MKNESKKIKIKPISFGVLLAGKVAAGTKTVTRRVADVDWPDDAVRVDMMLDQRMAVPLRANGQQAGAVVPCPYTVGQLLYVREPWQVSEDYDTPSGSQHIPDAAEVTYLTDGNTGEWGRRRIARFMPARFARTFLRVTGLRCERLWDITEADAIAEGVIKKYPNGDKFPWSIDGMKIAVTTAAGAFFYLWDSINGKDSHLLNPWVWVISFERVEMANPWNVELPWKPTWTKCDGEWLYGNRDHVIGCDYAITVAYDQLSTAWDWSVAICGKQTDAGYGLSADEAKSDAVKAYRKSSKGIAPHLL